MKCFNIEGIIISKRSHFINLRVDQRLEVFLFVHFLDIEGQTLRDCLSILVLDFEDVLIEKFGNCSPKNRPGKILLR